MDILSKYKDQISTRALEVTNINKKNNKVVGYEPCGECYKCAELQQAKKTAADAVFRYQEGLKYFSTIMRDMKK